MGLHVITTVADGYVPIGFLDAVIPFRSPYRPIWVGLGALTLDLLLAVLITSALRHRIGFQSWRFVHWLAYLSWPIAVFHGLGSGTDAPLPVVLAVNAICAASVLAVVAWRLVSGRAFSFRQRALAGVGTIAVTLTAVSFCCSRTSTPRMVTSIRDLAGAPGSNSRKLFVCHRSWHSERVGESTIVHGGTVDFCCSNRPFHPCSRRHPKSNRSQQSGQCTSHLVHETPKCGVDTAHHYVGRSSGERRRGLHVFGSSDLWSLRRDCDRAQWRLDRRHRQGTVTDPTGHFTQARSGKRNPYRDSNRIHRWRGEPMSPGVRSVRSGRSGASPGSTMAAPEGIPRLLAGLDGDGRALSLDEHVNQWGPPPASMSASFIDELDRSGLRGHGGAWFPVGAKWRSVRRSITKRPIIVANGAEGEPASGKDRLLVHQLPHLVLDGAVMAAGALGASRVIVHVPGSAIPTVERSIEERRRFGVDSVDIEVVEAPDRFLAGQESAAVNTINNRNSARPSFTGLTTVRDSGVGGRPTLVQNVESLAHVALIARFGADWFRREGTPESPGTALLTVTGRWAEPQIIEIPLGIPLGHALGLRQEDARGIQGVLLGGYGGGWLTAAAALNMPLTEDAARQYGSSIGAGVVALLPSGNLSSVRGQSGGYLPRRPRSRTVWSLC